MLWVLIRLACAEGRKARCFATGLLPTLRTRVRTAARDCPRGHPDGYAGPHSLMLRVEEGRLIFEISREDGSPLEAIILGLGRFRRPIRDYFAICDSYYQAIKTSTAQQIETVDMARRGLHNEAAEMLMDRLDGKIAVDFDTARRLFTLICVLHIKG